MLARRSRKKLAISRHFPVNIAHLSGAVLVGLTPRWREFCC
jgi:hypothetical protein